MFLSLSKCVLFFIIYISVANLNAKNFNIDTIQINPIVITSDRTPQLFSESGRSMRIISKQEIQNSPNFTLQDLLKNTYTLDIRQRGNFGVQADINARGGTYEQTQILLNGININNPQTGHHNFDLPIDLDNISKIEIIEGSASRVLGPSAFSGAVNIITGKEQGSDLSFSLMSGFNDYLSAATSISVNSEKIKNKFSINYKKSSGYIANTDFKNLNLYYQGGFSQEFGEFNCQLGYMSKSFGANSFYTADFPNQYEETKTTLANLKFITGSKFKFQSEVFWNRHQDKFELFRDNPASWYTNHNYHLTDVYGLKLGSSYSSDLGISSFGVGFRSEKILSNVLGDLMENTIAVPGEDKVFFTKEAKRDYIEAYLNHSYIDEDLSVSGGLYLNNTNKYGSNISPGIDISYNLSDKFKLFANYNTSLRLPTFTELFYTDPVSKGNVDLKLEFAKSVELGTKYVTSFTRSQVSIHYLKGNNLIDWTKQNGDSLWRSTNLSEVQSIGLNLSMMLNIEDLIGKDKGVHYINFAYSYLTMDKNATNYLSEYVLNYLRHKLTIEIDHDLLFEIKANWNFSYNNRVGQYYDANAKQNKDYPAYLLVNGKLQRRFKDVTVFLQMMNIFNSQYFDISNVPMPGRWIGLGIKSNLSL